VTDPAAIPIKRREALALHQHGRLAEAEKLYAEILEGQPHHFEAQYYLGLIALQTGQFERGVDLIARAIAINPGVVSAHLNLGFGLERLNRPLDALASYDNALALEPANAGAYYSRGNALRDLGRSAEALASYDRAIGLKPLDAPAHNNRGLALADLKRFDEAVASYAQAIALDPRLGDPYYNRGIALFELARYAKALTSYDQALALGFNGAAVYGNRAKALGALELTADAVRDFDTAIALKPDYAEAHNNRGNALWTLGQHQAAIDAYRQALALDPGLADAHWNLGLALLRTGRFDEGLPHYEWRNRRNNPVAIRALIQPRWTGAEDLAGKTLFVFWEQGLGDTINFARYLKPLAARGASIVFSVPESLRSLLSQLDPNIQIIGPAETPARFDYQIPVMSLALASRTNLQSIPSSPGYLAADPALSAAWKARLPVNGRPSIGLAWSGNPQMEDDRNRSTRLESFLPLLSANRNWISVQKEVREVDAALLRDTPAIRQVGDRLRDFADTAALIDALDLVVTVDTSVAHLAGALGKPAWILLCHNPDWRWLRDRDDSPWYPSARLFRQAKPGDWAGVIARVVTEMQAYFGA
jgi:tetratricopeptide (TPR) repeat protein/ADP-heptose:LPS heptosyltransferase